MFTGFRFRRELEVLPWLKFNLTKTGISATIGPEVAHVTVGRDGPYVYVDMPGKGTYFRRKLGPLLEDLRGDDSKQPQQDDTEEPEDKALIERPAFSWLAARPSENAFVGAMRALNEDDLDEAYAKAKEAAPAADGAYLAGFLAIKHQEWEQAVSFFEQALENSDHLGELFAKYEVAVSVFIPVAEDFATAIQPNRRDCLLAIAIAHERMEQNAQAVKYLQEIREDYDPDDLIVRLLLAELLDEIYHDHPRVQHEIVTLAEGIQNDSPLHAALMYYRARALRRLGLMHAARDTFTKALRKKKGYPADLLSALRYERALLYEDEGQEKRAHEEFEKIYAVSPELEDVAERLGLAPKIEEPITSGPLREKTPSDVKREHDTVAEDADFQVEATDD